MVLRSWIGICLALLLSLVCKLLLFTHCLTFLRCAHLGYSQTACVNTQTKKTWPLATLASLFCKVDVFTSSNQSKRKAIQHTLSVSKEILLSNRITLFSLITYRYLEEYSLKALLKISRRLFAAIAPFNYGQASVSGWWQFYCTAA